MKCLEGSVSVKPAEIPTKESSHCSVNLAASDLYVSLLTNTALCLLRVNEDAMTKKTSLLEEEGVRVANLMRPCIRVCRMALDINPSNAKAWYRLGQVGRLGLFLDFRE